MIDHNEWHVILNKFNFPKNKLIKHHHWMYEAMNLS